MKQKTKKRTRRVASKAKPRRRQAPARRRAETKTELVLSSEAAQLLAGPVRPPAAELVAAQSHLTEDADVRAYGTVEIKLTPEEEKILSEPVNEEDVAIKPTGQAYLPHPVYTRWLNRAFGRTGWALVPVAKPVQVARSLVRPYMLHIHGKPVAFAEGEQIWYEDNKDQSYGDALESTVASSLRRCCKHLGIGLELWDRAWLFGYLQRHAVKVLCEFGRDGDKKNKVCFRKKTDPPFWNEKAIITEAGEFIEHERKRPSKQQAEERPPAPRRTHNSASSFETEQVDVGSQRLDPSPPATQRHTVANNAAAARTPAPAHHDGTGDQVITEPQKRRLWTIASNAHRTNSEVKEWLAKTFGYDSSSQIKRKDYDRICSAIEHPGPLGGGREPGQEG